MAQVSDSFQSTSAGAEICTGTPALVGIIMVIAMLALPAAAAGQFTRRLVGMMIAAVAISILCTVIGLVISYEPELPAGATIILTATVVYCLAIAGRQFVRKRSRAADTR